MISDTLAMSAIGVRLEYGDRATRERLLAIERIDLKIREGEFVSIVGPSGCGKTSFLKIVDGLIQLTEGEISLPRARSGRDHAMVFQDASLFPWYSVLGNVAYGLACQGLPKKAAQERALAMIQLVGLSGFETKFPYQLSGGMQQRANLARALAVDPGLLLMDEPFASLDAQSRELMQVELQRICSRAQKTVLFVTHQIEEAIFLSDRVIVMSARPGRILADVSIELPRPRELETKRSPAFVGYVDQIWKLISRQLDGGFRTAGQAA